MLRRPRPAGTQINSIFKLYPWETMLARRVRPPTPCDTYKDMRWIEPIWKMLLSNKGILPILWELYPNHALLLDRTSSKITADRGDLTLG